VRGYSWQLLSADWPLELLHNNAKRFETQQSSLSQKTANHLLIAVVAKREN